MLWNNFNILSIWIWIEFVLFLKIVEIQFCFFIWNLLSIFLMWDNRNLPQKGSLLLHYISKDRRLWCNFTKTKFCSWRRNWYKPRHCFQKPFNCWYCSAKSVAINNSKEQIHFPFVFPRSISRLGIFTFKLMCLVLVANFQLQSTYSRSFHEWWFKF